MESEFTPLTKPALESNSKENKSTQLKKRVKEDEVEEGEVFTAARTMSSKEKKDFDEYNAKIESLKPSSPKAARTSSTFEREVVPETPEEEQLESTQKFEVEEEESQRF